jgi:acetoin utilization deacetylase AcuC-like enzyme
MPITKFSLVADGLRGRSRNHVEEPAPLDAVDLLRVHTREYVDAVRTGEPRALAESMKFTWSPQLYPSVLLTGGGLLAAARRALTDGVAAAVVSGFHHAHADHGEGFCTFNSLVVAAELLHAAGVPRIAVLDMDLHYGNGTASLAPARPYLLHHVDLRQRLPPERRVP